MATSKSKTSKTSKSVDGPAPGPSGLPGLTPAELADAVGAPPFATPRRAAPSGGPAGVHDAIGNPL